MWHGWCAVACLALMLSVSHLPPAHDATSRPGVTPARSTGSAYAVSGRWLPSFAAAAAQASPLDKLAGVPASKRDLYLDVAVGRAQTFVCFDGGATLPASAVNDDYCDCADGSDEPGTSACPQTEFYCANKGHVGKYIPSSLVNDGVCDCCDGSDEAYNPNLGVSCTDTCLEAGAAHRAEQAEAIRVAEEGARLKANLAADGLKAREDLQVDLAAKKAALDEARATLEQAEATAAAEEAKEAEEREARETNRDDTLLSALGLGPDQPGGSADNLRVVLLSLVRRANASAALVDMLNEQAQASYTQQLEAFNHRVQRGSPPDAADGPLTPPVPPTEVEWPESLDGGGYTRAEAEAARAAVQSAEDAVATLSSEVSTLERQAEEDYGPNYEWWSLRNHCVESTFSKYKYSVCPYKEAKQDHTRLGSWKGFKDKTYSHMLFTDGATCWNGPKRSITVELRCGLQEELSQVEEPSTCTYTAVLHTPAACDLRRGQELDLELPQDPTVTPTSAPAAASGGAPGRDEL